MAILVSVIILVVVKTPKMTRYVEAQVSRLLTHTGVLSLFHILWLNQMIQSKVRIRKAKSGPQDQRLS